MKKKTDKQLLQEKLDVIEEKEKKQAGKERKEKYEAQLIGKCFYVGNPRMDVSNNHDDQIYCEILDVEIDEYDTDGDYDAVTFNLIVRSKGGKRISIQSQTENDMQDNWFHNLRMAAKLITKATFDKQMKLALEEITKRNTKKKVKK